MKTIAAFLKANFKAFFRDKTSLFFSFGFPVVFMLIFGMLYSGSDTFKANIGLVNHDGSPAAQGITDAFRAVPAFTVKDGTFDEQMAALKKGDIRALVVIPEDLAGRYAAGERSDITVYYDPAQTINTQVVIPVINSIVNAVNEQMTQQTGALAVKEESIQAHKLSNMDYLVPGIIAMSILMTGLFSALPFIEQREKKILKRLGVMPIRRSAIIFSQIIFRLIIAVMQSALLLAVAAGVFHVQMLGNWFVLAGFVLLGTLTFVCLGYLLGSVIRTSEAAIPVIQLVQFPMMFLSGIFFPIETMPGFLKPVVTALPLSYLGDAFRQVMAEWTPFHSLLICALVLAGWVIVCTALSIKFFRWE